MNEVEENYLEIEAIIHPILERSGSDVQVKIDGHFPGGRLAGGKYTMSTHTVTLYIEEIKEQCMQIFGSLSLLPDYLSVIFAHELGHAQDRHLAALADFYDECTNEFDRSKIAFLIEKNAWKYAEKLMPEISRAFVKKIIAQSLKPYYEKMELQTA